jgi:hypothetical protein
MLAYSILGDEIGTFGRITSSSAPTPALTKTTAHIPASPEMSASTHASTKPCTSASADRRTIYWYSRLRKPRLAFLGSCFLRNFYSYNLAYSVTYQRILLATKRRCCSFSHCHCKFSTVIESTFTTIRLWQKLNDFSCLFFNLSFICHHFLISRSNSGK